MDEDEFIKILREDYREYERKYNARNPLRKLWDKLNIKQRYWHIKDWFNQVV